MYLQAVAGELVTGRPKSAPVGSTAKQSQYCDFFKKTQHVQARLTENVDVRTYVEMVGKRVKKRVKKRGKKRVKKTCEKTCEKTWEN